MIQSKPVTPKYLFEIYANCNIQLGIEVCQPNLINEIIDKLNKTIIGLHLKLNDGFIHTVKSDPPIFKIPNFLKLQEASEFFVNNYFVNSEKRLGSIGYCDDKVILNISHAVGDGGYFRYIIDHLFDTSIPSIPNFPNEASEIFNAQIKNAPNKVNNWSNQTQVNRVTSNNIQKLETKNLRAKYITNRLDSESLSCLGQDGKIHSLTDNLWTSIYLATAIHNGRIDKQISMPTCIDLRRYLNPNSNLKDTHHNLNAHQSVNEHQKNQMNNNNGFISNYMNGYDVCNCFSNVTPFADVSLNSTIGEIGLKMRQSMHSLMNQHYDFGVLRVYDTMNPTKPSSSPKFDYSAHIENAKKGCGVELTYVGPIHITKPITDVWIGHSMLVRSNTISLMGFGIESEDKNEIITRLRFPPNAFSYEEAAKMAQIIEFCLKNVKKTDTVAEAIEKITHNIK
ncbi:hypothetical protein TRFO_03096 [Tritrichomonas foetus]|uniref:Condensation domain-containing protein n=1 Tax=Tritrichomonas foetus TaxID=1144522 RepID=A0A1J4KS40_9EUKA|nr:hypothetical protein TRFO_03096 [Tritrichomonas foetus]|eukprot:OHT14095.1 hypothetical protein TRFO_03096 [Tritrichomonas foetus]